MLQCCKRCSVLIHGYSQYSLCLISSPSRAITPSGRCCKIKHQEEDCTKLNLRKLFKMGPTKEADETSAVRRLLTHSSYHDGQDYVCQDATCCKVVIKRQRSANPERLLASVAHNRSPSRLRARTQTAQPVIKRPGHVSSNK